MSLYALPGLVFPPITSTNACTGTINSEESCRIHEEEGKKKTATTDASENASHIGIAVKSASIDPELLVGSPKTTISSKKRNMKRLCRSDTSYDRLPRAPVDVCSLKCTPHDDAVKFDLTISFHGRTYSATRTMHSIMKLRSDLIREMHVQRQWLQRQVGGGQGVCSTHEDEPDVVIPELPCMEDEGFVGRGFTMLQAFLKSYCPAMEGWLKRVTDVVPPDSPSFADFLWEPSSTGTVVFQRTTLRKLCSIEESDSDSGTEED